MKKFFIALFALSAIFAGNAHASIITFGFEVSNFTPFTGVNNTDVLTGQFSFDTTIPDQGGIYPNIISFDYTSPFIDGSGTFGGLGILSPLTHQQYRVQLNPSSGSDVFLNSDKLVAILFTFAFPLGTFADNSLLLTPPDISQTLANSTLNGRVLALNFQDQQTFQISSLLGEVTSLTYLSTVDPSTVPEPTPLLLLGLGLVGIGVIRRRKA